MTETSHAPSRHRCAEVYVLPPEEASDCEKGGCDRIAWVEVDVMLTGEGLRAMRLCERHAGDFITYMLPRFGEDVPLARGSA